MTIVVGWDVGGAHLKAARAENGRIVDAVQVSHSYVLEYCLTLPLCKRLVTP